jgi:DNA-binding HxlR family transcriptional regulator
MFSQYRYEIRPMVETITHLKVPMEHTEQATCLGPDGSVAHVGRVFRVLSGRWKLPILFRLFAAPSMRSSQLLRDIPGISQKMLTQHLRELEKDGLVERQTFPEQPPRVEYRVTSAGRALMPVLLAVREFSRDHLVR